MSAVGVFGGTFDPIHLGHLITAASVREIRNLEKIIFIPAFTSPHKTDIKSSGGKDRLEMVKLAVEGKAYFEVCDYEIKNEGISFTIDTLRMLKEKYSEIELIIGYDNLIKFSSWKQPDDILKLAKLVVLNRKVKDEPDEKDVYYKSAFFVDTPLVEISASGLREKVRTGGSIDFLVPEKVKQYIYDLKLFKD